MGLNKKTTIIFVTCVLFGALFDLYILKQPQAATINYLPYIFGTISFLMGVYASLLCFKIYTPKYKTVEQALRVDNLLRTWGNWGKFGSVFLMLFGAYTLIRHDPNMYRLNGDIETNKWTSKDRKRLLEIYTNDLARKHKEHPELVQDYCECVVDNIMKSMGRKEYIDDLAIAKDEQNKIFAPVIKDCAAKYQDRVDSAEKQRKQ